MSSGCIVQIMPKEKFTNGFIAFTRDAFPEKKIVFIVYGDDAAEGYKPVKDANTISIGSKQQLGSDTSCRDLLNYADAIILNWVDLRVLLQVARFISKTYLLFWGGDLYPYIERAHNNLRLIAKRVTMRRAIARAAGVLTLVPSDLGQVERLSKEHGPWHQVMMVGNTRAQVIKYQSKPKSRLDDQGALRILLGNSATPTNRHYEVIQVLSKFEKEDIVVFCPLSYGDSAYGDEIARLGGKVLGQKFVPLRNFMNRGEYDRLLASMNIGIFNHSRQQGLGNINRLMSNGAKVYMSRESGVWHDFEREGRIFFPTELIEAQSFDEFRAWDIASAEKNMRILNPITQFEQGVALWRNLYENIVQ